MKILAKQVLKTQVLIRRVLLCLNAWNRLNFGNRFEDCFDFFFMPGKLTD